MKKDDIINFRKGSYRLVEKLARGGQGTIWKVIDGDSNYYAMKVANLYDISTARRTLHTEKQMESLIYYAKAEIDFLTSLDNSLTKHIVVCLDHGFVHQEGYDLPAFIMPLYQHDDLSIRIKYLRDHGESVDPKLWLLWFRQLALALQSMQIASTQNNLLVHRDLKPSNCLLSDSNDLLLIDFGIVRESSKTGTTSIVYTYDYCAPEQRLAHYVTKDGAPHYYITPALDVYSAAMVMHEIVVGGTRAQVELNEDKTKWLHEKALHELNEKPIGRVGLLGEIGGLSKQELENLRHTLVDLFSTNNNQNKKTITKYLPTLLNYHLVASELTDLINRMLAPWPDDRPNIDVVLQNLAKIDELLKPDLYHLTLIKDKLTTIVGQELLVDVAIVGKGLPSPERWLEVSLDQSLVQKPKIEKISADTFRLHLPAFSEVKKYTLKVSANVNKKEYSASATIEINPSANYLWSMGKRVDALKIELRDEWLDQWEVEADNVEKKYPLLATLKSLQKVHPVDSDKLQQRYERINIPEHPQRREGKKEKSFVPSKKKFSKIKGNKKVAAMGLSLVISLISLMLLVDLLGGKLNSNEESTLITLPDLAAVKKKLHSLDFNKQREGRNELLKIISEHKNYSEAIKLKEQYGNDTLKWNAKSESSRVMRDLALTRLKVMAEDGEKNAQYWLAIRYLEGDGVEKSREIGIKWTQKAADQGVENAIETLRYLKNEEL